jgi:hypothetical protein
VEADPDEVDDRVGRPGQRRQDRDLCAVVVEVARKLLGRIAARDGPERVVELVGLRRSTELDERRGDVLAAPSHSMPVRREPVVLGLFEICAVLREQPDRLGTSAAAHRVHDVRILVRIGSGIEQQPDVLGVLVVERVRKRHGAGDRCAVLEQHTEARGALRLA